MMKPTPAVVDTDVFSLLYVLPATDDPRIQRWRELLAGRRVFFAFHTRAEILAGAMHARWGAWRMAKVSNVLDRTPTIRSDDHVVDAYATLTATCRRVGHALHDKIHTGDRWIAACAIARQFELLAGDRIYRGAPNLVVRS